MIRHVTGWLWGFLWFRDACLCCVSRGWLLGPIYTHTPLLFVLKRVMLEDGDFAAAADIERMLSGRQLGYGGAAPHRSPQDAI